MDLVVLPEIEKSLFSLRDDEFAALENSVLTEGIRDALVVWPRNGQLILVDGHHRYKLAKKYNLAFRIQEKHFGSLEEVLAWIDANQLARRNLTDEQRAVVLGRIYERQKKAATGFADRDMSGAQNEHRQKTAEKIASFAGVGQATVRRAAEFAKAVDKVKEVAPKAVDKILAGKVRDVIGELPRLVKEDAELAHKVIAKIAEHNDDRKQLSIKEIKREIKTKENKAPKLVSTYEVEIRRGDFREVLADIPDKSVDVILTDSPYGKQYLPLWDDLGRFAARVLKPSGFLVTYCGQLYLPDVLGILGKYLQWWWMCGVVHAGQGNLTPLGQPVRKVINQFKPLLIYIPKDGTGIEFTFRDLFEGCGSEKSGHNWQQPVEEAKEILQRLAPSGAFVVDPFAGSGSFGEAAKQLGMRFLGAEVIEVE